MSLLAETSIIDINGWWGLQMKDKLLSKEPQNVIIIDWINGAKFPYHQSAANTRLVGAQVAQFLMTVKAVAQKTGVKQGLVHIIGFSLGAHVAGYVGRRLKEKGNSLNRITGKIKGDPVSSLIKTRHVE